MILLSSFKKEKKNKLKATVEPGAKSRKLTLSPDPREAEPNGLRTHCKHKHQKEGRTGFHAPLKAAKPSKLLKKQKKPAYLFFSNCIASPDTGELHKVTCVAGVRRRSSKTL